MLNKQVGHVSKYEEVDAHEDLWDQNTCIV